MRLSLFESFASMVETMPARAIIPMLERERRMLEEDLDCQRPVPAQEAASILAFCRFIEAARKLTPANFPIQNLPARQVQFYRQTVARLVAADGLPYQAKDNFDQLVDGDWLKIFDHKA